MNRLISRNNQLKLKPSGKFTDHVRGLQRIYLQLTKKSKDGQLVIGWTLKHSSANSFHSSVRCTFSHTIFLIQRGIVLIWKRFSRSYWEFGECSFLSTYHSSFPNDCHQSHLYPSELVSIFARNYIQTLRAYYIPRQAISKSSQSAKGVWLESHKRMHFLARWLS